jgi:hypothetical protein
LEWLKLDKLLCFSVLAQPVILVLGMLLNHQKVLSADPLAGKSPGVISILPSHWQEADMRLQSDIDALAAIEEGALMMLKWIGLPADGQKLEVVICL